MFLVWNFYVLSWNLKILPFHDFWKISSVQFMVLKNCFLRSNSFTLSWSSNILSSSWFILLVRLSTEFFIWLTESLNYSLISVWVFFIVFFLLNSIFMSWIVILISFSYLLMFSWNPLRSLFLFSLSSFSKFSMSYWKSLNTFMMVHLNSLFGCSSKLPYEGPSLCYW